MVMTQQKHREIKEMKLIHGKPVQKDPNEPDNHDDVVLAQNQDHSGL